MLIFDSSIEKISNNLNCLKDVSLNSLGYLFIIIRKAIQVRMLRSLFLRIFNGSLIESE